jgi:hypothetical protein
MAILKKPEKIQLPRYYKPIIVMELVTAMDTRNANLSSRDCHNQSTVVIKKRIKYIFQPPTCSEV